MADESDNDLARTTGDYLASSFDLPSDKLDVKKCTDANKEQPSRVSLILFSCEFMTMLKVEEFGHLPSVPIINANAGTELCFGGE